ncbi:hypothetical protein [Caulobacter sp. S45]|uniref:hypothetical protein n=1 Tax=Caulobacter sp. S45 TaxID=1641861 RepID=UPI00131E59AA|nr:hypothetical protein [Caulobacter sp. S45]
MSFIPHPAYSEPMHVSAEDGEVVIMGPHGLSASFTPDAAAESARRLLAAVAEIDQGKGRLERESRG